MFIETKSLYYYNKFKCYRNKLKLLIRKSKIDYYNKYFNTNKTNFENIWRGIKKTISLKLMNSNLPSKILRNNKELTDCKSIANAFTDFFANIGHSLALKIPSVNTSSMTFMPPKQDNSIYVDPTSSKEIEKEIDKLASIKATGPYSIPTKILKLIKYLISKPLETIFNLSFVTSMTRYKQIKL